ncbi:MAG: ATP phosphoribosyltransferase regulatory subunit [Pseudomonadales bacterium]|jgi:ATP phosphoribosyltransferase regulatory subunit|nr:ATP phosphoribosyltransferase regulatory subunit [Pseudomonadales bacterium]
MTTKATRWLLPDGVDELLPPFAAHLEQLRREILDLYQSWGYELIKTPLIEFLDSLLILPSEELQLSTFTLVDQLSGKSMGVRADISSQAARIDAQVLRRDGITRLCYADSALCTRPRGPLGSRCPHLIGAELYGHGGSDSDAEVIGLLLRTLHSAGIEQPLLALGHNQLCQSLLKAAALPQQLNEKLFSALQNKASADLDLLLNESSLNDPSLNKSAIPAALISVFKALPTLHGDASVLKRARELFAPLSEQLRGELNTALTQLENIAAQLSAQFPAQALYFDLCERRGYDYHTGVIFSAYVSGHGEAIANGGRYDAIGEIFGRPRAATGFDADLKTLLRLSRRDFQRATRIYAPAGGDAALARQVAELRAQGKAGVQGFDADPASARAQGCSALLRQAPGGAWQVETLD